MGYAVTPRGGRVDGWRGAATVAYADISTTGSNVKGTWQELCAALPVPIEALTVCLGGGGSAYYQVDLGIGAAGSEVAIIQNILFRTSNDFAANVREATFLYPLPAGTRIVARQSNSNGTSRFARTALVTRARGAGGGACIGRVVSLGASAFSAGTDVDPGGTANTKGAWVEFAASLANPVRRVLLSIINNAGVPFGSYRYDVGVGAAGSEVAVIKDVVAANADIGQGHPPGVVWGDCNIPAGSRLAVRCASEATSNRLANLVVHCQG